MTGRAERPGPAAEAGAADDPDPDHEEPDALPEEPAAIASDGDRGDGAGRGVLDDPAHPDDPDHQDHPDHPDGLGSDVDGPGTGAPPSPRDLVQAVADFVDDLVEDDSSGNDGSGSGDSNRGDAAASP